MSISLTQKTATNKIALAAIASVLFASSAFAQNTVKPIVIPDEIRAAQKDAGEAIGELRALVRDPSVYATAAKREETLTAAKPLFVRIDAASAAFANWGVQGKAVVRQIDAIANPIRAALGEPAYTAKLETLAKDSDEKVSAGASAMLAYAKFMAAGGDEAAQKKSIAAMADALKVNPASDQIAATLNDCYSSPHAIKEVRATIEDQIKNVAKSPTSAMILRQWAAAEKLAALDGKPLTIKNFTLDGKPFSSDTLKGKVVMVDFWATWCGPCIAELPRLVDVYNTYHPKGLEIISISFDQDTETIKKFLGEHNEIKWIQLFNPQTPGWSAGDEFGINSIPRMFLIDKKGVVRTVNGRATMEKLIPELLAE
jgi:thiol-disulfide isomerase/thioredoxin